VAGHFADRYDGAHHNLSTQVLLPHRLRAAGQRLKFRIHILHLPVSDCHGEAFQGPARLAVLPHVLPLSFAECDYVEQQRTGGG